MTHLHHARDRRWRRPRRARNPRDAHEEVAQRVRRLQSGLQWERTCAEVSKLRITRGGRSSSAEQPIAAGSGGDSLHFAAVLASRGNGDEKLAGQGSQTLSVRSSDAEITRPPSAVTAHVRSGPGGGAGRGTRLVRGGVLGGQGGLAQRRRGMVAAESANAGSSAVTQHCRYTDEPISWLGDQRDVDATPEDRAETASAGLVVVRGRWLIVQQLLDPA